MTINDLNNVQNGTQETVLMIIQKFTPLIRKYAHQLSYEDAYNDLVYDLIYTLHSIHIDKMIHTEEATLVSYICTSIHSSYVKRMAVVKKNRNFINFSDLSEAELCHVEEMLSSVDSHSRLFFESLQVSLTMQEWIVLRQIYYYGYSVMETADYLGVTRQAVNQMKNRALERLQRELK